jgi:crotonobetainyl-CoA:carnitine CoA-transferase CaiB-like acyl-CoA transferase
MGSNAPLAGIRVVEITSIYSGPFAGMILAELGAEVIKVESTGKPDLIRNIGGTDPFQVSPVFYSLNKGKRFVSIDASTPRGAELLADLVASADVFLHNIRPGKPDRIGLRHEELVARNPRLIYAEITGLGSTGPDAGQPVYDYVIQARSGMVDYQRDVSTGQASLISQVLVDKTSAQAAVQGILAALYVRERTGQGQRVEVPMLGVGMHFHWPDAMALLSEVSPAIPVSMFPPHMLLMPAAGLVVLRTSDGGEVACSPLLPPYDGFAIALDRPEWVVDERLQGLNRMLNFPAFKAEMDAAAARFTTEELLARFRENDVAAGPVVRRSEIHNDPQVQHLGLITEQDTGTPIGTVRQPAPMWRFEATPAERVSSIGRVGADTRAVLAAMGLSEVDLDALGADGVIAWPEA